MAAEVAAARGPRPIVEFLKIPESGSPYLEGQKCRKCSAIFGSDRTICHPIPDAILDAQ